MRDSGALLDASREWVIRWAIDTDDEDTAVFSLGRRLARGSRMKAELEMRRPRDGARSLTLHPGGLMVRDDDGLAALCATAAKDFALDAIVPDTFELALGPEELERRAKTDAFPFVAANLFLRPEGAAEPKRPFPRYRLESIDGLDVAIVGLVGRDRLAPLPAAVRNRWVVADARTELERTLDVIRDRLGRRPDVTIALVSADELTKTSLQIVSNVDIIVGGYSRHGLLATTDSVRIDPAR